METENISVRVYHGSMNKIEKASDLHPGPNEIGIHFGSLEQAKIVGTTSILETVIPNDGNSLRLKDEGNQFSVYNVAKQLALMGLAPDLWRAADIRAKLSNDDIWNVIWEKGYRRVVYLNRTEVPGANMGDVIETAQKGVSDEEFKAKFPGATDSYILKEVI